MKDPKISESVYVCISYKMGQQGVRHWLVLLCLLI